MTLDIDELERVGDLARQRKAAPLLLPGDKIMCRFEDEALANWPAIIAALREGERLREAIETIRLKLEQIVCVVEPDDGVVLLSNEGPTHWDDEFNCQVYDHLHFSPLGDALIELHKIADLARKQPGSSKP